MGKMNRIGEARRTYPVSHQSSDASDLVPTLNHWLQAGWSTTKPKESYASSHQVFHHLTLRSWRIANARRLLHLDHTGFREREVLQTKPLVRLLLGLIEVDVFRHHSRPWRDSSPFLSSNRCNQTTSARVACDSPNGEQQDLVARCCGENWAAL